MGGWKTWAGVIGLMAGAVLTALGFSDIAETVYTFSVPMVIVGIGHKLDKVLEAVATGSSSAAKALQAHK